MLMLKCLDAALLGSAAATTFVAPTTPGYNHVIPETFDELMDSSPLFLTGNTDTVYCLAFLHLEADGPTVFDKTWRPGEFELVK